MPRVKNRTQAPIPNTGSVFRSSICLFLSLWAASVNSQAHAEAYSCEETGEAQVWLSPLSPKADEPVKIMAVSAESPISEMALLDSHGRRLPLQFRRRGGPPWSLTAALKGLKSGDYFVLANNKNGRPIACQMFKIGGDPPRRSPPTWGLATEAFYSAWIEALFDAPPEENFSYASLEPILRNRERNFLHNYLGFGEDQNLPLTPDCADLPYTLRAYFAWKVGLPLTFRACRRGSAKVPPRCGDAVIKTEFTDAIIAQAGFRHVNRQLTDMVHSGSARTGLEDDATDLYPLPMDRTMLWPGTVYADPYGHVLVLSAWMPQTANRPGMLLAVDAQPDNTIARKRFWEGNFLFATVDNAGPGFKAFRPLVRTNTGGWRTLSNSELVDHPGFRPFSLEQERLSPDDFYASIARFINPRGLDPRQAYEAMLDSLIEQLEARVTSINNGEAYYRNHTGNVIPMPRGAAIFQTIGPWEDYSTPSRDMRLIIAINVLEGLPEKIVRHPELFVLNGNNPEEAKIEIQKYHAKRIQERRIGYTRTDGSPWELSIAEVLARRTAYEMAYNPNDCAELRWGAKPGTEEYSTCRRHAPREQHKVMEQYRNWFREAQRPAQ